MQPSGRTVAIVRATRSAGLSLLSVVKVRVSVPFSILHLGIFFRCWSPSERSACRRVRARRGARQQDGGEPGVPCMQRCRGQFAAPPCVGCRALVLGAVSHRSSPKPLTAHFVAKSWAREEEADKSTFTRTVSGSGVQVTGLQRTGTWRPFCVCRRGELPRFPVAVLLYAKLGCVWYVARAAEWPSSPRTTEGPVLLAKAQCR